MHVKRLRIGGGAADAAGQDEGCRLTVTGAGRERLVVAVRKFPEKGIALGIERGIAGEVNIIEPVARARPGRGAEILDGPRDRCRLAGKIGRLSDDAGDLQIGRRPRRDVRGSGVGVVAGVRSFPGRRNGSPAGVGVDDHVLAGDLRRKLEGVLRRVGVAGRHHAVMLNRTQIPLPGARNQDRIVREIDVVKQDRIFGWAGALILHGPLDRVEFSAHRRRWRGYIGDDQVGWRRQQDGNRPRLVIVIVELIGIVRVDIAALCALENGIE